MRSWITTQQIPVKEIVINEFLNPTQINSPGDLVQYLGAFEAAKVYGSRACWDEANNVSSCWNYSLNGALTPDLKQPRADWWVYKFYTEAQGKLIAPSSNGELSGLAAVDENQKMLTVLLGKKKASVQATHQITLTNVSALLPNGTTAHITIQKIPNAEAQPIITLPAVTSQNLVVANNQLSFSIAVNPGEAYLLKITSDEIAVPTDTCPTDVTKDTITDLSDYAIFQQNFLKTASNNSTAVANDFNHDGIVDLLDYSLFGKAFLKPCP